MEAGLVPEPADEGDDEWGGELDPAEVTDDLWKKAFEAIPKNRRVGVPTFDEKHRTATEAAIRNFKHLRPFDSSRHAGLRAIASGLKAFMLPPANPHVLSDGSVALHMLRSELPGNAPARLRRALNDLFCSPLSADEMASLKAAIEAVEKQASRSGAVPQVHFHECIAATSRTFRALRRNMTHLKPEKWMSRPSCVAARRP